MILKAVHAAMDFDWDTWTQQINEEAVEVPRERSMREDKVCSESQSERQNYSSDEGLVDVKDHDNTTTDGSSYSLSGGKSE